MAIFSQAEAETAEAMMERDYSCGSALLNLIKAFHTDSAGNLPCVVIKIHDFTFDFFNLQPFHLYIHIYREIYMLQIVM